MIDKSELRLALVELQREVRESNRAVAVLLAGLPGSGKGDTLKKLNEWMDVRYLVTHAFHYPSAADRQRPPMWRYWMSTPSDGEFRFYTSAWYEEAVTARVKKHLSRRQYAERLERLRAFERTLVDDGAIIVKLWFEMSRRAQAKRFAAWQASANDAWRVTPADLASLPRHDDLAELWAEARAVTDLPGARWIALSEDGDAPLARRAGEAVRITVRERLDAPLRVVPRALPAAEVARDGTAARVPHPAPALDRDTYKAALEAAQGAFGRAVRDMYEARRAAVMVFEGWDAAGKGGAIRRLVAAVDPRQYRVVPIGAPDDVERAHHYLWRFWRHVPRAGHLTVYDRSWYGRVLVERVEGFASESEWTRAYDEIVEFERELAAHGITIVKFWLEIGAEEQLARFAAREQTPHKRHKITREDYRNRARRDAYEQAVADMLAATDTGIAPWQVIAAEDKRHARIAVLEAATRAVSERNGRR